MSKSAICNRTGTSIPLAEGFFVTNPRDPKWEFVSRYAPEFPGDYSIAINELVRSPEELVDWLAHLNEKTWFSPRQFFQFLDDFRDKNRLYGC